MRPLASCGCTVEQAKEMVASPTEAGSPFNCIGGNASRIGRKASVTHGSSAAALADFARDGLGGLAATATLGASSVVSLNGMRVGCAVVGAGALIGTGGSSEAGTLLLASSPAPFGGNAIGIRSGASLFVAVGSGITFSATFSSFAGSARSILIGLRAGSASP